MISEYAAPTGLGIVRGAFSTEMSLLTELEVVGKPAGPSFYHLLEVLGKEKSLTRIEKALESKFTNANQP